MSSNVTLGSRALFQSKARARVAELRQRIQGERDPKAIAELRAEVGKLTQLLAELMRSAGADDSGVQKSAPMVWPRDLSASAPTSGDWGTDPAEVAGG